MAKGEVIEMIGIGFFRLVLALTVVVTHTHSMWGFSLGNPVIAVRTFFIISGFYMTLVLSEKYQNKRSFWWNRALKIYPIYWATMALTIGSCIGAYLIRRNWGEMYFLVNDIGRLGVGNQIMIVISQITILGREIVMWRMPQFLLIPQAWTLVLELWFYLLAPYVVKKKWWIVAGLMMLSIMTKQWLKVYGYTGDLWEYRFFPAELTYFLMGTGSYHIYKLVQSAKCKVLSAKFKVQSIGLTFLIAAVGALTTFNYWGGAILTREWWFYGLMMILIPCLFLCSKKSLVDRQIGELSYPVYITHILVNNILNPLLILPFGINRSWQAPIVMAGAVGLSFLINFWIQRPIETIRENNI